MRIDSHQHFWRYDPIKDAWIDDARAKIKNDYFPPDVWPLMQQNQIEGCIAVQADQSEQETHYLLKLADEFDFIKGVVGWVDLCRADIEERLAYFSQFRRVKGFRHIVQSEPQVDFLLRDDFCRGISMLNKFGYTYDILIYPKHLPYAAAFVKRFPDQKFVVDHLAKPFIKDRKFTDWKKDLAVLASFENVSCKLAGLVTEADWLKWQVKDFEIYIMEVLELFGVDRVIFGSDWPVCLLGASYDEVCEIVEESTRGLTDGEKRKLWGGNCQVFYNL